jgi:hypothetical protein
VSARLAVGALLVTAAVVGVTTRGAGAQTEPEGDVALRLDDVSFAVAENEPITLDLTVLGGVADVIPVTTTSTTTTTTTTVPPRRSRTTTTEAESVPAAEAEAEAATIVVKVHLPIDERGEVAEALDGQPTDDYDDVEFPLASVLDASGPEPRVALSVPTSAGLASDETLTMRVAGLYPISVELHVGGDTVASHVTIVERTAADAAPSFDVSIVATTPGAGPDPDADAVTRARDDLTAMAALGAATDDAITYSIPPALLRRVIGDDDELAERLRTALADDEAVAVPIYEFDPSSAVEIDEIGAFTDYLRDGEDLLDRLLPSTPARRATWIVDRPLSAPAADALRDLGYRMLLLDDELYLELDGNIGGFTDSTLVLGVELDSDGTLPALVTSEWGPLLDRERPAGDTSSPADRAVRVVAELLALRAAFDPDLQRAAVLAASDFGVPDADTVAALSRFVEQSPELRMVPLSALPGTTDQIRPNDRPLVVALPPTAGPDLTARAEDLENARIRAASAASMLPPDDPRPDVWDAELDTLLSTGLDDDEADAAMDAVVAQSDAVRSAVQPPPSFTFTLTGRTDKLRLRIGNDAAVALRVVVRPSSPKLEFLGGEQLVDLAPQSITNVEFDVEALSNGTSPVTVELRTPLGETLFEPIVLTAHVNALSGLGQVITGGALLVLLAWWASHLRRNRVRRRRAVPPAPTPTFDSPDGNGDGPPLSPDAAEATAVVPPAADSVTDP